MRIAGSKTALARLAKWISPLAAEVLVTLRRHGAQAFLVGGGVRDAFLGVRAPDWDVATDAAPADVASWFPRVVRAGEKHGTIMVVGQGTAVEVTTFRGEGPYLDGRRPSHVVFHRDIAADLARRDLTINAMAADLERRVLIDPFGGCDDLRAGRIRCVGVAEERFREDGLRPLRAVRFAASLGFAMEARTRAALGSALDTFELVAWERKRDELERMLGRAVVLDKPILLLERSGLLASLAPELLGGAPSKLARLVDLPADPWLRFCGWAALLRLQPSVGAEIVRRWRGAKADARRVEDALDALAVLPKRPPAGAELRRWLSRAGERAAADAASLAPVHYGAAFTRFPAQVRRLIAAAPPVTLAQLAVSGRDLETLGLRGPLIGEVLRRLLAEVLENPQKNQRETLLARAHSLSTGPSPT